MKVFRTLPVLFFASLSAASLRGLPYIPGVGDGLTVVSFDPALEKPLCQALLARATPASAGLELHGYDYEVIGGIIPNYDGFIASFQWAPHTPRRISWENG